MTRNDNESMVDRFLLYVDVLGFAELSVCDPDRVDDLFEIVASLNLFRHDGFAAITFSDTILVHNAFEPESAHDRRCAVMYLCEFFRDLVHRIAGRDLSLRSVLTYGPFEHYRLNDIPFFYGPALIRAYRAQKDLQVTGLLMDDYCRANSHIFSTRQFGSGWYYTFVTQAIDQYEDIYGAMVPLPHDILGQAELSWHLGPELELLSRSVRESRLNPDSRVRAKHAATLDQFRSRYPGVFAALEADDFRMEAVNPDFDWSRVRDQMMDHYSWSSRREAPRRGGPASSERPNNWIKTKIHRLAAD